MPAMLTLWCVQPACTAASKPDVAEWIVQVWRHLDPSIIQKGFIKCSIANAMDGSEDDALWADEASDITEIDNNVDDLDDDDVCYPAVK